MRLLLGSLLVELGSIWLMSRTFGFDACCRPFYLHFAFIVWWVGQFVGFCLEGFLGFLFGVAGCIVVVIGVASCGMLSCSYGWLRLRDFSPCF